ncbi:hypothetical protein FHS18_004042 [Paenibacillus phyllosphaerae]|uniref:Coenzyme PQQ synthesis protein D (PqqD) n=1 Tax=Paenibacillus phyllosphaerae TaxID=274593 RepID=A0A7W5FPF0_9BACL|nr:PqqD family protein [Paenibacillus phyllosphaerae]MBB3111974.1 hypothetical protein [Paenibacillus phyllosphaerae]
MRYIIPEPVQYVKDESEVVIINMDNGLFYTLDKVGTEIWDFILVGKTIEVIIESISKEYKVNKGVVESDVFDLIKKLLKYGLVKEI